MSWSKDGRSAIDLFGVADLGVRIETLKNVKVRIVIWAIVGAAVVLLWNLAYIPKVSAGAFVLAYITCPIILLGRTHNVSLYTALLTNAVTYALIGTGLHLVIRCFRSARARQAEE